MNLFSFLTYNNYLLKKYSRLHWTEVRSNPETSTFAYGTSKSVRKERFTVKEPESKQLTRLLISPRVEDQR